MKTLLIDDIQPGMILAEDIYSENYILLIAKHTVIDRYTIVRLKEIGIVFVSVEEDDTKVKKVESVYDEERRNFIQTYENSLLTVREFMNQVRNQNFEVDKIKATSEDLMKVVLKNYSVIGRLYLVKDKDDYTYTHCVNVAILSAMIGEWLGLPQADIVDLACAGLLHDMGKTKIDDSILNKPGKLTDEEYEIMQGHALEGFSLLCEIPDLRGGVVLAALGHHERYDGRGYPLGLRGKEAHLFARIVAVADIYDAMTSNRIYRKKVSPFTVAKQIADDRFGVLDPEISQIFLQNVRSLYVGNRVVLSNGVIGDVIFVDPDHLDRPVIYHDQGVIDLQKTKEIDITDVIW